MPALRLGFLLSGTGRTLENLLSFLDARPAIGEVVMAISSKGGVRGLALAEHRGIPSEVQTCPQPEDSAAIFDSLDRARVDYALLGGWLRLLRIPESWRNRVLNIHPSLIPRHSGTGFYGRRVHESVLSAGDSESGCTVHFVDNVYDHGPVLLQERVPVLQGDDPDLLAARVFEAECRALPRAVELLASGQVNWRGGQPRVGGC